jgi:hypothetical protein
MALVGIREEAAMKTMADFLGPFNPDAEVLGCLIVLEVKPKHHKILATFATMAGCAEGFENWKAGK